MIDNFALALTHGLIVVAFWRLLQSDALDHEVRSGEAPEDVPPSPGGKSPRA
ncbi:hypothetical protein [Novosphingobium sp.]|jgi:hypothetical protein|uniref:hypothetical protein n=1 Tax=Novosphingobium sp. TaxID=1874826 RepID=UPI001EB84244|nr:hypothetical protein [Novosphingobium sp.]MBK6802701.1 hypothetical protein [Novosphingobium sp.]MBK9012446.1 hypothetical protein [Novosphingobium sp.]